jgi:hypothetical protein
VRLLVWNAQGANSYKGGVLTQKWEALWANGMVPLVGVGQSDNVAMLLCEAGWAPWIDQQKSVSVNTLYRCTSLSNHYDTVAAGQSAFCQAVEGARRWNAFWLPWLKTLDTYRQNVRCSMGGCFVPHPSPTKAWKLQRAIGRYVVPYLVRPVVVMEVGIAMGSSLTVLMVHLVSNNWAAQDELNYLMWAVNQLVASGSVLVIGDMNIDLQRNRNLNVPDGWSLVNHGQSTHQGGGELDWALLRDPGAQFRTHTADILKGPGDDWNVSDHAVMSYTLA